MSQSKDSFPQYKAVENPNTETDAPPDSYRGAIVSLKGLPYVAIASQPGTVADVVSLDTTPLPVGNAATPERGLVTASVSYAMEWQPIDTDVASLINGYFPYSQTVPMEVGGNENGPYSLTTLNFLYAWAGIETQAANYIRLNAATATNQALDVKTAPLQVAIPGTWSITHAPATNTRATITRAAAGSNVRHICTGISALIVAQETVVAGPLTLNLRDGATGAGTILKSWNIVVGGTSSTSADRCLISLSGLQIAGSENTAMTLEFSAAGGVDTFESVNLEGYDLE